MGRYRMASKDDKVSAVAFSVDGSQVVQGVLSLLTESHLRSGLLGFCAVIARL